MATRKITPAANLRHDADLHKGALEPDNPRDDGNGSLRGQLGHRTEDDMIKGNDSDFPEPGGNPEHSGEPEEKKNSQAIPRDQDRASRQKRNQAARRKDRLAS